MSDTLTAPATVAEVIEQITAIQPLLRKNAAEGEQLRQVPAESIDALRAAGAFRVGTPSGTVGSKARPRTCSTCRQRPRTGTAAQAGS